MEKSLDDNPTRAGEAPTLSLCMLWQLKDTQVSEKLEHSQASAHGIDEWDEAARGLGDKVRDAGSQMAGHATELLKEAQTRGASVAGE